MWKRGQVHSRSGDQCPKCKLIKSMKMAMALPVGEVLVFKDVDEDKCGNVVITVNYEKAHLWLVGSCCQLQSSRGLRFSSARIFPLLAIFLSFSSISNEYQTTTCPGVEFGISFAQLWFLPVVPRPLWWPFGLSDSDPTLEIICCKDFATCQQIALILVDKCWASLIRCLYLALCCLRSRRLHPTVLHLKVLTSYKWSWSVV